MGPELIERSRTHGDRAAIRLGGEVVSHAELVRRAEAVAAVLLHGAADLAGARVAYLLGSGPDSVATLWGIWLAGGVAVPLALSHPAPELWHTVTDAGAAVVVADAEGERRVAPVAADVGARLIRVEAVDPSGGERADLPEVAADRPALIVYTSGSTGRPKGAVWRHAALVHQVDTLADAWRYDPDDVALLLLPLHHVHGLINVVTTTLACGGSVLVHPGVEPVAVWEAMADITVLMAVPTIYHKLIAAYDDAEPAWQARVATDASRLRLMVSGSAALPVTVLERWDAITGHVLLERYGMTEIGMALSNPYDGPRVAGSVGRPLPGVQVRVVDEAGNAVPDGEPGGLLVRAPGMFSEYWQRSDATAEAFLDGWFTTGDVVIRSADGTFRIHGRESVDIIKTGGFKVSALEVEEVLRTHPAVVDCAVVGVPDDEWGQVVAAAVVTTDSDAALGEWMRDKVASYKVPRMVAAVDELPRNALGKVVKPRVLDEFMGLGDTWDPGSEEFP